MAMAASRKPHPYKAGFEPFPSEVYRIPYAYCFRCSYSLTYPSCEVNCARHFEDTFKGVVAAESVAAVIVEPILGEGGFVTPPAEFYPTLGPNCRKHSILLSADEVQTGFARTGAMFACERLGLEPDLVAMAKAVTGGLPMAAVTGRADIMDAPGIGQLGGTFGGNPAACEAALAVLDIIEKESLCARANVLGERFRKRAAKWQAQWELVGDVRGLGAMQALELVRSKTTREPADEETKQVSQYCYEHGLVLITAGSYGNVIRLLMPLVVTDAQMDEAMDVLEAALADVLGRFPVPGAAEVTRASNAAQAAYPEWRRPPAEDRIQPLFKLKMLLEEHLDDFGRIITQENGKTFTEAKAEMRRAIENVEVACGIPMMMQGYNLEDVARGIDETMIRQPLGVVAAITPVNVPGMIPFWVLPYAIACGS